EAGGSVPNVAACIGIRPSTAKRHVADLRAIRPHDRATDLSRTSEEAARRPESGTALSELDRDWNWRLRSGLRRPDGRWRTSSRIRPLSGNPGLRPGRTGDRPRLLNMSGVV